MLPGAPVILLVEDNKDHAELIIRSIKSHSIECVIQHVQDGIQALDYIFQKNEFADTEKNPRPRLILMDLRMPRVDGIEVLQQVKGDKKLRCIPIVVLTTSKANQDVCDAFSHYANSYLVKPLEFEIFRSQIIDICTYWLKWNEQPDVTSL